MTERELLILAHKAEKPNLFFVTKRPIEIGNTVDCNFKYYDTVVNSRSQRSMYVGPKLTSD